MDKIQSIYRGLLSEPMGRIARTDYWTIFFFNLAVLLVAAFFLEVLFVILSFVFYIVDLLFSIKRYHDSGHKGWWLLCPVANFIFLFYNSTEDNQWGPSPI